MWLSRMILQLQRRRHPKLLLPTLLLRLKKNLCRKGGPKPRILLERHTITTAPRGKHPGIVLRRRLLPRQNRRKLLFLKDGQRRLIPLAKHIITIAPLGKHHGTDLPQSKKRQQLLRSVFLRHRRPTERHRRPRQLIYFHLLLLVGLRLSCLPLVMHLRLLRRLRQVHLVAFRLLQPCRWVTEKVASKHMKYFLRYNANNTN